MTRYAMLTDEPELRGIRDAALGDDFRFQTLIKALVTSDLFQNR